MSGSSAGVSCSNPYPNAAEKAAVESRFGSLSAGLADAPGNVVTVD
ncbi:hypothetical protein ACF052_32210 [Streptomyces pilosus]